MTSFLEGKGGFRQKMIWWQGGGKRKLTSWQENGGRCGECPNQICRKIKTISPLKTAQPARLLVSHWQLLDSLLVAIQTTSPTLFKGACQILLCDFLPKQRYRIGGISPLYGKPATLTTEKFHLQGLKMVFLHKIRVRIDQKKAHHRPNWAKSRLKRAKKSVCGPKHNHFIVELGIPPPLLRKSILPKNKLQIWWVPPPPFTEKMCEVEVIDRLRNSCNKNSLHCLEIEVTNLL